jgi:hypothetical protein
LTALGINICKYRYKVATIQEKFFGESVRTFDYYRDDLSALSGSTVLDKVKSVFAFGHAKGEKPLPDNMSVDPELIVQYGNARGPDEVRKFVEQ